MHGTRNPPARVRHKRCRSQDGYKRVKSKEDGKFYMTRRESTAPKFVKGKQGKIGTRVPFIGFKQDKTTADLLRESILFERKRR
jgi:hypothetical protein